MDAIFVLVDPKTGAPTKITMKPKTETQGIIIVYLNINNYREK